MKVIQETIVHRALDVISTFLYSNSDSQQFHQKNNNLSPIEHKKDHDSMMLQKPKSWQLVQELTMTA